MEEYNEEVEDKCRKRALRRKCYAKLKRQRGRRNWLYQVEHLWDDKRAAQDVNTPTPCSCTSCGNPRRHFGLITISEVKSLYNYIEGCKEVGLYCSITPNQIGPSKW